VIAIKDDLGSGARARAIASLALALATTAEETERSKRLQAALAAWTPAGGDLPASPPSSLTSADATVDALRAICDGERRLRLQGLHDVALELRGTPPRYRRRATTLLPVTSGIGRLLLIEAWLLEGALPGLFELPEMALADRHETWRQMESEVETLVDPTGSQAVRYRLTDRGDAKPFLGPLKGRSGGMALAVAALRVTKPHLLPLDGRTAIAAAIAGDGRAEKVDAIAEKLSLRPPDEREPDVRHLKQARVRRLLVEPRQAQMLAKDPPGAPPSKDRRAVSQAGIRPVAVEDLEQALRKAGWRPTPAGWGALAAVAAVAIAIVFALNSPETDAGLEQRVAESQLPGKVEAAVRRLDRTDPDLAALLRAEQATVQPTPASLTALLDARGKMNKRVTTFRPSSGNVTEVEVAAGGNLIFTGGANGEIRVWDRRTQNEETLYRSDPVEDEIWMLAASPNGRLIGAGGTRSVVLAELGPYGLSAEIDEQLANGASAVALAHDGETFFVGTEDALGVTRHKNDGWTEFEWTSVGFDGHYVRSIFPLDDSNVAFCLEAEGNEQDLHRLNLRTYAEQVVRDDQDRVVQCPVTQLTPNLLATTQGEEGNVVAFGELEGSRWHQLSERPLADELFMLHEVPGGRLVYAAGSDWLAVVSAAGRVVDEVGLHDSDVDVDVGAEGRYFAAAASHGSVRMETLRVGDPLVPRLQLDNSSAIGWAIDWSANGERVAIGTEEGELSVFDPDNAEDGPKLWRSVIPGRIRAVELDDAGRWVWVAGDTGQVARVDARDPTAEIEYSLPQQGRIRDLELSPDGQQLAVAGAPGTGVMVMPLDLDGFEQDEAIDALALTWLGPDRILVAGGTEEEESSEAALRIIDTEMQPIGGVVPTRENGYLAVRARGNRVAAVGPEGGLDVFDVSGNTPRLLRSLPTGNGLSSDVAWSPDGKVLALVGDDDDITYFETDTFQEIGTSPLGESGGGASLAAFDETLAALPVAGSAAKLVPFGVRAWSQEICDRTKRFLSPADWVETVGVWPAYRAPCRPPT
jgi:WD40 repeat protein